MWVTTAALVLYGSSAGAQGGASVVPSALSEVEKVYIVALEQAASVMSALVDKNGCFDETLKFTVDVFDADPVFARVELDDAYFVLRVAPDEFDNPGGIRGTVIEVLQTIVDDVGDTTLSALEGRFVLSRRGEVMHGRSQFALGRSFYGAAVLGDYYEAIAFGRSGTRGSGYDVSLKFDYPRAKWLTRSWFARPNGDIGGYRMLRERVQFAGTVACSVRVPRLNLVDFGGGIQAVGVFQVRRLR